MKCEYKNDFFTSEKVDRSFEIYQRIVYSVRFIGQGYTSIEKFNALMNIPPLMTTNNYEKLANKIVSFTKDIAEETMRDAAIEIHSNTSNTNTSATVVGPSVLCDGVWDIRSFLSNNGVFAVISLDNGKVLEAEPLPKFCKCCIIKND